MPINRGVQHGRAVDRAADRVHVSHLLVVVGMNPDLLTVLHGAKVAAHQVFHLLVVERTKAVHQV